jgi:opacity protein-like surface antigen
MPNTVILKAGTYKLSKDTQDFLGSTQTFDGKSKSVWGAEYEYRVWHGVAIGAEYGQFRNTMTSSDSTLPSTMDVKLFLVKVKKYFEFSDIFQPYVGVGVGAAWANFDGWINGDSVGGAYAALGGMEFRFKHVGVYTEYRYLSSKTSGKQEVTNDTVNIHVGGSGAFAGVSIHF